MERSLLDILRREDILVMKCNRIESEIRILHEQRDRVEKYPLDCEAKRKDLQENDEMVAERHSMLSSLHIDLAAARKEIRAYFKQFEVSE